MRSRERCRSAAIRTACATSATYGVAPRPGGRCTPRGTGARPGGPGAVAHRLAVPDERDPARRLTQLADLDPAGPAARYTTTATPVDAQSVLRPPRRRRSALAGSVRGPPGQARRRAPGIAGVTVHEPVDRLAEPCRSGWKNTPANRAAGQTADRSCPRQASRRRAPTEVDDADATISPAATKARLITVSMP